MIFVEKKNPNIADTLDIVTAIVIAIGDAPSSLEYRNMNTL